jgi:hypothetical protein
MAIGPAMVMGGLAILALATLGKKSEAAPQLPSGKSPGLPGIPAGTSVNTGSIGPLPVVLPEDLAELVAKALRDLTVNDDGTISGPVTAEAVQRATTVAAQVENAGFPDAARSFRAFIQAAAKKVPSLAIDKQVKLPGVSPAIVDLVNRAVQLERDPKKLQAILDSLRTSVPPSPERELLIEMLANTIKQVNAAIVMAETLKKTEEVLKSPGLPPQPSTRPTPIELPELVVTSPPFVPPKLPAQPSLPAAEIADTVESRRAINTANHLRNKIADMGGDVKKAKGKEDKSMVKAFQSGESITSDGLTGPGTVLKMAKYTGDIPLVYYWPKSATAAKVNEYRSTLRQMADAHENAGRPTIASKLRNAATKERGQAGIVGTMPA